MDILSYQSSYQTLFCLDIFDLLCHIFLLCCLVTKGDVPMAEILHRAHDTLLFLTRYASRFSLFHLCNGMMYPLVQKGYK